MGGAQTLEIATGNLSEFAYVGVFSSGVFGIADNASWRETHHEALSNASLRTGLKLVWFATGSDDFLLETSRLTVDMLRQYGFDVDYAESTGGHTWINWREYLHEFLPLLFREGTAQDAVRGN